ncbi:MAG TPA: ScpA family protein [Pirellulaceae bacterium]|nr:ScpA family protein [Pirellulaceae bacterium]HMO92568.1 ScpA family protein [Pirellulaceae bacterium]HMP70634.1 ScpA family protein [Pirellulaceae bacterium]
MTTALSQRDFRLELDHYKGPVDLLLFLVKRNEVAPEDLPVAQIAKQYSEFLELLEAIDIDLVGDFLEIAGLLVEAKLRAILPKNELLNDTVHEQDPREDLVSRLLLYKQYKDAAELLGEQVRIWQDRFTRIRDDLPPRKLDPADQPIQDVELWDLVSAFGRVLKRNQKPPTEEIIQDETPITEYMKRIHGQILHQRQVRFSSLFQPGMHKSALVGVFLAILELVRHHRVNTEQSGMHGDIIISAGEGFNPDLQIGEEITFH